MLRLPGCGCQYQPDAARKSLTTREEGRDGAEWGENQGGENQDFLSHCAWGGPRSQPRRSARLYPLSRPAARTRNSMNRLRMRRRESNPSLTTIAMEPRIPAIRLGWAGLLVFVEAQENGIFPKGPALYFQPQLPRRSRQCLPLRPPRERRSQPQRLELLRCGQSQMRHQYLRLLLRPLNPLKRPENPRLPGSAWPTRLLLRRATGYGLLHGHL
jgi:hypothetical protein